MIRGGFCVRGPLVAGVSVPALESGVPPRLVLLDAPAAYLDGRRFELPVHKPAALLLVLACAGDWVGRERLVALFWPDSLEEEGRHRLRTSLMRARRLPWAEGLEVEAARIRWRVDCDVRDFREAVAEADWAAAAELHRRPLLDGFSFPSSPGLEAWLGAERDSLSSAWQQATLRRAAELKESQRHADAATLLERVLRSDSLAEDALAAYLEAAYLCGRRGEALTQYQHFREALRTELDLDPLPHTSALAALIREGSPLEPAQVQPAPSRRRFPSRRSTPRLVGRSGERAALLEADAPLAVVFGEAGSGKSSLLRDALPSARWLRAREGLRNVPFHPLLELVGRAADEGTRAGLRREELALLDPIAWPLPADALAGQEHETAKTRLLAALAAWLEDEESPLIVDDLQWADSGTLELLTLLMLRGRIRCHATCRSEEVDAELRRALDGWRTQGQLEEIQLGALDPNALTELASGLPPDLRARSDLGHWLLGRSAGNPFFALEVLRELEEAVPSGPDRRDEAAPADLDHLVGAGLPTAVQRVVDRRVGRLSAAARRVLEAGSVLGSGLGPRPLAALAGLSEVAVLDALEEAEQQGLLRGPGFSHDLWRQGVYQGLTDARRRHLHYLVAESSQGLADPLIVAEHWGKAGSVVRALAAYHEGADALVSRGFPAEALRATRAATALVEAWPVTEGTAAEVVRLRARLSCVDLAAHKLLGQRQTVMELAERLSSPEHEADVRVAAYVELFNVNRGMGRYGEAKASLEAAERLAEQETLTASNRRLVTYMSAVSAFEVGRYRDAIALCEGMRDAVRQGTALERFDLAGHLAASWNMLGESDEALRHNGEALALAKAMGGKPMVVNAVAQRLEILIGAGRAADGVEDAEAALRLGSFNFTAELRHNLVLAYRHSGRLDEAIHHGQVLVSSDAATFYRASGWVHLINSYAEAGRKKEAAEAIDNGLLTAVEIDVQQIRARMLLAALRHGSPDQKTAARTVLLPLDWARLSGELSSQLSSELGSNQA